MEQTLLDRFARILRVDASELRVGPLTGGISNRSFVLTRGDDQWAVRLPLPARAGKTLDPQTETHLLTMAANEKLTPEVVAFDAQTGALMTRYLRAAKPLNSRQVRERAGIDRIAAKLRRLHRLPVPAGLPAFQPEEVARIYVNAACAPLGKPPGRADEARRWRLEFRQLAKSHAAAFKPAVLCHNDLVAANILDDGRVWFVDFEYAVRADPILDLAGLAGLNRFRPAHCHRLLNAYYGSRPHPITSAQLDQAVRLVRLMAFFWALAHGGDDPADGRRRFAAAMAAVLR